jgi:hypothetical protein
MKRLFFSVLLLLITVGAFTQEFPGLKPAHKKQLLATGIKIPLPTWLPDGFILDTFETKIGKSVRAEDKALYVQYSKKLNDSTWQSFMVEAGFDGPGSLSYERDAIQSQVGKIEFYYQPHEEIDGKKEKQEDLISTEWFEVNKVLFHVLSIVSGGNEFEVLGDEDESETKYNYIPLSKEDFKKILQSLQILK